MAEFFPEVAVAPNRMGFVEGNQCEFVAESSFSFHCVIIEMRPLVEEYLRTRIDNTKIATINFLPKLRVFFEILLCKRNSRDILSFKFFDLLSACTELDCT